MTQILLLFLLMSGSVFGSAVKNKHFEELLPVTCTGIIVVLFLSGICNMLNLGVYIVITIGCVIWLTSILCIVKNKEYIVFLKNFVTPGFLIFIVLYIVLGFLCRDMVATEYDEFSHWADIVKAMVIVDDFGTNSDARVIFPSYLPGMALFQYFFQKVYLLLKPQQLFSEWRLFFAYQIFFISFLMPFLKDLSFRKPMKVILFGIIIWLAPTVIFVNVYSCIYIDAILGFVAGSAFSTIFLNTRKDWLYHLYIYASIVMLVLMKDAGMLFAAFLLIAYMADIIYSSEQLTWKKVWVKKNLFRAFGGICALIIPKILWMIEIKLSQVSVAFSNKINFGELLKIILGKEPDSYRTTVLKLYTLAMMTHKFSIGNTNIEIPYLGFGVILLGVSYLLYYYFKKSDLSRKNIRKAITYIMLMMSIIFVVGMCVSYMYKFSEEEALSLAAFSRYQKILFHCLWVYVFCTVTYLLVTKNNDGMRLEIVVFCTLMLFLPWANIGQNVTRITVDNAIAKMAPYQEIAEQIENISEDHPLSIHVVSTEQEWCESLIFSYLLRPNRVAWNYAETMDLEKWRMKLSKGIDYVALYNINENFIEQYSDVFKNSDEIEAGKIYLVNVKTGLLELVK